MEHKGPLSIKASVILLCHQSTLEIIASGYQLLNLVHFLIKNTFVIRTTHEYVYSCRHCPYTLYMNKNIIQFLLHCYKKLIDLKEI